MYTIIVLGIVTVIVTLALIFAHSRITAPLSLVIITLFNAALWFTCDLDVVRDIVVASIASILSYGAYLGILFYFRSEIDYTKKFLSLSMFIDKNKQKKEEGRVIGKCLPYFPGQTKYNRSTIVQNKLALRGGTVLTGSSGSGKTRSIIEMIKQDIAQDKRVAYFNFKGDQETADEIMRAAEAGGKDVYFISPETATFCYDPLASLDDAGKVEAILGMRKWSLDGADDHYKTGTQLFLQKTIEQFNYQGGNYLRAYYNWLKTYNCPRELFDSYNTVMKLLELTLTSSIGNVFTDGEESFSFEQSDYVLIVSFTSATKTLGTAVTSLMLRDIMETGTRFAYNPDLALYIDEFGSCESPLVVKDILEKGRSCHIQALISMQDLNQLIINTNAPFLDSVLGTINTCIVYAGSTKTTAEKFSQTTIHELDNLLMSLMKPLNGKPPTAMIISKYPIFERGGTEVYRFVPSAMRDNPNEKQASVPVLANFKQQEQQNRTSLNYLSEEENAAQVNSSKYNIPQLQQQMVEENGQDKKQYSLDVDSFL